MTVKLMEHEPRIRHRTTIAAAMVLRDCQSAPDVVIPCVETATDVAEIESSCLIALDDDGEVESRQFREN